MVTAFHLPRHSWRAYKHAPVKAQRGHSAPLSENTHPVKMSQPSTTENSLPVPAHAQQGAPPAERLSGEVSDPPSMQAPPMTGALLNNKIHM